VRDQGNERRLDTFAWRGPEISELEAVNLPDGSVLGIAVPAAAAQRRDRSPAIAHFDSKLLASSHPSS
jgi:hypothetical protein